MTSYKPHHTYKIAPAADLGRQANAAFRAADYHLVTMKKLQRNGQTKHTEFNTAAFHRELRSFFWELSSSYETMLHWTNRTFHLEIDERTVSPDTILAACPRQTLSPEDQTRLTTVRSELENARASAWLYEIRLYRNFSIHRGYMAFTAIVQPSEPFPKKHQDTPDKDATISLLQMYPVRQGQEWNGDMFPYLDAYLEKMAELGRSIFTSIT